MYLQTVRDLRKASVPVRELPGPGAVAVTLAAGRIVALAFSDAGPNLLWTHPDLGRMTGHPGQLVGGIGGDRLWFAPELHYHWLGEPDWQHLTNYTVPGDTEPGHYDFVDSEPGVVALAAKGQLPVRGTDRCVAFRVERRIRMAPPPIALDDPLMRGVQYVGVEATHELTIADETRTGEIDLWHLLQMPIGSILIVPLRPGRRSQPLAYGVPGPWSTTSNSLIWRIGGSGNAKMGIGAEALTGRAAILQRLPSQQWCLLVRQFPVDGSARYGDHPYGVPRADQVFQAWDGLGFGELEYHSPVLDAERGPRSLREQDQLWAFGGAAQSIAALADTLLQVDIRALLVPPHGPGALAW
jgi:hypothetical protein